MTETASSSSASPSQSSGGMTIDIRPMIEDVSQVMTKHITNILTGVIGEYTVYKETHDTIMNLPCVRKLQDRIHDLERIPRSSDASATTPADHANGPSREDEIAQLQSAIVELNRYIIALETKVDMKAVCGSSSNEQPVVHHASSGGNNLNPNEEETVRLEIHEEDDGQDTQSNVDENTFMQPSSNIKNVIISSSTMDTVFENLDEDGDEEDQDNETEGLAQDDEACDDIEEVDATVEEEEQEAAEEEAAEEDDAGDEEEAAEEEVASEEEEAAEEEEAVEEEETAEEEEAVEEEEAAEDEVEAAAEEEEAEIEVSEVTIKGKKYFTTDTQNGTIYACVDDDVGDEVGVFKNGVAVFTKGKK